MASIETYKRSLGAKVLKRLMVGKPVDPEDIQNAAADPHYGLIIVKTLVAEKPADIDEWDDLIKRILSYTEDGKQKYEALAAVDPNLEMHTEAPDRWGEPFTLVDAYEPLPPLEYVIKGLFPVGDLAIMYGAPGSMKSLLAAQMLIDVTGGFRYLERRNSVGAVSGFETVKRACMWLDFDNGKRRTHERIRALAQGRSLSSDAPFYYYSMPWPIFDASDSVQIGEVADRIKSREVKFVVIDNLGIISGDRDENGSQMQSVIGGLRRLAEEACSTVVVIHHSRKSGGFNGRAGDSLRGHGSIEAGIDLGLLVSRKEQSDLIEIKATKVRGSPVYPFAARFSYEHKGESDELNSAKFFGEIIVDTSSDDAITQAILDVVSVGSVGDDNPLNQSQIIKQVKTALPKASQSRTIDVIRELVSSKKIIKTETGKNNACVYTVPGDKSQESEIQEKLDLEE